MTPRILVLTLLLTAAGPPIDAQVDVSGYALGLGSLSGSNSWSPDGNDSSLGRARLMLASTTGPVDVNVAYEHLLTWSSSGQGLLVTTPGTRGSDDWLGADWELWSTDRSQWRHRFDRLSVRLSRESWEVTVGRQAISWATTLVLTPGDPFAPFDPSDPFRVYRAGVDAIRVRAFPGPFTEVDAVYRPHRDGSGREATALVRAQTSAGGWAVGGWVGALRGDPAGAAFATGSLGAAAVRTELSLRDDPTGGATVRGTLGVDLNFTPRGKDLYLVGEVQYDGFGARGASNLLEVVASEPFARGEMQVLAEWSVASQISYQIHPLVGLDALVLASVSDGSVLVAPGATWSATSSASARIGLFGSSGKEGRPPLDLGSEYGPLPPIGYVSLTWFF